MKKIKLLQYIINLIFFVSIFSLFKTIAKVIQYFYNISNKNPFEINRVELPQNDYTTKSVLLFSIISAILMIYFLNLLNKLINHFLNNEIFSEKIILLLNKIGITLLVSSLTKGMPMGTYYIYLCTNNKLEHTKSPFSYHIPEIILALFFLVLGEVFKIAKGLKEENELTV